ncbi:phosphotransferase family protein [Gordonia rhizosphera]|uniref:Putative phosphotransferase n=1 Tax=Gordonia rhizosphera NBRC 16068 TaxID=1108045 RepID=K6WY51_9ACTN|nr:phosphotransferase family protein [Gordonia rhizosphera]GAB91489.1 putative phosphotransferase [Gordonia rhizosphera NBRC 16068]
MNDTAAASGVVLPDTDMSALRVWLGAVGIEPRGEITGARIGFGQSNLTYVMSDEAGARWVLRRPPVGHLLASAHDVAREARILSALADTDVPVPRIYGVCRDDTVSPVPIVAMEYVDGTVLSDRRAAEPLPLETRHAVGIWMTDTLARIHTVDLDAVGLSDLASHKPYAPRQLKRWSTQWEQSKTREIPELDALTRRLAATMPEQHETTLVHGDFHLRNVMIDPASGAVTAALDWELSTLGDPLADIGSTLAYWPEPTDAVLLGEPVEVMDGFCDRGELARAYLQRTGRDPQALKYWHALGLWKVAIIAEGVLRRARDNPANRAAAGVPTPAHVDDFVARAVAVADDAGL